MSYIQPHRQFTIKAWIGLSIIPALLFISAMVLTAMHGPYYLSHNFDPEYAYLLNSLNLLLGKGPGHTDHPGTSVQIVGAAVVGIRYGLDRVLGITGDGLVTAVLSHPESYLKSINLFLNFLIAVGSFLVGYRVFYFSGYWLFVIVLQIVPYLFVTTLMATTRVMPEPFMLFITYGLVFFLLPFIFNRTYRIQTNRDSVFLGAILGLGVVTKVTFLPLVLLLWLPDTLKRKFYAFVSMVLTFLLITLPIWDKYVRMAQWWTRIATHNGRYGKGEAGIGDLEELIHNLFGLIVSEPIFFIIISILIGGGCVLFWQRRNIKDVVVRRNFLVVVFLFIIIILGQTALTIKHPPIHYAFPSMGIAGLMLVLLLSAPIEISGTMNKLISYGAWIFLVGAIGITAVKANEQIIIAQNSMNNVEYLKNLQVDSYPDCTVAYYYRSSNVSHALDFGNSYAASNFGEKLEEIYSNELFYHIFAQKFQTFTTHLEISEMEMKLANGECILMQGTPFVGDKEKFVTSLILERLDENVATETLYQLIGFKHDDTNS